MRLRLIGQDAGNPETIECTAAAVVFTTSRGVTATEVTPLGP